MSNDNRGCFYSLLPCYDELSLFVMSVSFLFIYFTNSDIQLQLYEHVLSAPLILAGLLLVFFAAGMTLSLYHAFSKRPKTEPEKLLMLYFGIIANYAAGIAAAIHIFREASSWLFLILPALNIVYAVVPVLMGGATLIDDSYVRDDDVTPLELATGLAFLAVLLVVCQYYHRLYWAITFSVCVAYATGLSGLVQSVTAKARSLMRCRHD